MRNRDALVIRTPEGIEFSLPLAGPFSRMLALVIDIAVIIMLGSFLEKVLAPLLVFGQDLADALAVIGYFVISDLQRARGVALARPDRRQASAAPARGGRARSPA